MATTAAKGAQPASKQEISNPVAPPTGQIKTFDNLRAILRSHKQDSGVDLYQHLVEVMNYIVMHCPDQGLDQFEEISYLIKNKDKHAMEVFLRVREAWKYNNPSQVQSEGVNEPFLS